MATRQATLQPRTWLRFTREHHGGIKPSDMSTLELIEREITHLPEPLQRRVYDFAVLLRTKAQDEAFDGAALSQSVLARDWETPEEDSAWANL